MRLGIATRLVLTDPLVEAVAGHVRLNAAIARRAAVIERQFAIDNVRDEVGLAHRKSAHRIGRQIVLILEIVSRAGIAVGEIIRAVEDEMRVVQQVHHVRRRRAAQDDRRRVCRIHEAMVGVERDREHRAALPFKRLARRRAVVPHFRGAATFDHETHLLVNMLLDVESAAGRHFNDIHAPQAFRAEQLDICALAAQTRPGLHRQIENRLAANVAENGNAFGFHEGVIRHRGAAKLAQTRLLARLWFVPVIGDFVVRHGFLLKIS